MSPEQFWLVVVVCVLIFIIAALAFDRWLTSRPLTPTDRYCDWADQRFDELDGRAHPRPARLPVTEALNEVGDGADAVVFDFPWEDPRPALRVIQGGRDTGGWAA